ncbi:MAG: helix-turn-helix domain-containing protein, partial [Clostridiales bacterium]|nr:helix-turn-helix domain-containing protein [Clostridiales bacterium]
MKTYNLGERLKHYRLQAGLTQAQLAAQIGKTSNHITHIERGFSLPSLSMLADICRVLEIPADCFIMENDRIFAQYAVQQLIDILSNYTLVECLKV